MAEDDNSDTLLRPGESDNIFDVALERVQQAAIKRNLETFNTVLTRIHKFGTKTPEGNSWGNVVEEFNELCRDGSIIIQCNKKKNPERIRYGMFAVQERESKQPVGRIPTVELPIKYNELAGEINDFEIADMLLEILKIHKTDFSKPRMKSDATFKRRYSVVPIFDHYNLVPKLKIGVSYINP